MGIEIERKFLVSGHAWREGARGTLYRQGYLSTAPDRTVRVRVAGERGFLTIKGRAEGLSRAEFEYEIPLADAHAMLTEMCVRPLIEKTRYLVEHAGHVWEVDEFAGDNAGLVVAEVELEREDQEVPLPAWVGTDVSEDARYTNASLVERPYSTWASQ